MTASGTQIAEGFAWEPRALSRNRRLLSPADELSLAKAIERGDLRAKECMIESNLRLVFAIARSYRGRGVPFEDLVQEGTVGLVRAVEKYDHRRGLRFSSYAVWWIRRSLIDAIATSQVIRIPSKANQQLAAVRRAESDLRHVGPGRASTAAIAGRTGLSTHTVRVLQGAARVSVSLDEPLGEDLTPLGDVIADESAIDPAERAIAEEGQREIAKMLHLLPKRHREVLVRRYGLDRQREQSYDEIGAWLGVGAERCRQLEREALYRLRAIAGVATRAAKRSGVEGALPAREL